MSGARAISVLQARGNVTTENCSVHPSLPGNLAQMQIQSHHLHLPCVGFPCSGLGGQQGENKMCPGLRKTVIHKWKSFKNYLLIKKFFPKSTM